MAITSEQPDTKPQQPTSNSSSSPPNPFKFWFFLTLSVSLITPLFISLSSLSPQDSKSWFLSLPTNLRQHYSNGRIIKVQITPNQPTIEVFTLQEGPVSSLDNVLILHGLGCSSYSFSKISKSLGLKGVRVIAVDLPGSGFSEKSSVVVEDIGSGVLGRLSEIYYDIKEKGIFWGFDQLVEQGYIDFEEKEAVRDTKREVTREIILGPDEMGRVLSQVIDSMELVNVDLVLHDSALALGANWVLENSGTVRSVTILDGTPKGTALPLWVLDVPVLREVVLGFKFVFESVIVRFCSRSVGRMDVEANRIFLKSRNGRKSVVGMGKSLNYSLDLEEWGSSDSVKGLPMQVIWSSVWSEEWTEEGHRVAKALPWATFVTHSGGRWPQEDKADELAENIYQFLSLLPKPVKQIVEDPIPEHIQKMFDESQNGAHHHHHDHAQGVAKGHAHGHDLAAGHVNAYGLNDGWGN